MEQETFIDVNSSRFRKGDELYYMLKNIKKAKSKTSRHSMEEEIMRIDLQIEGQPKIRSIPIELGGVRSFLMENKEDEDETKDEEDHRSIDKKTKK